MKTKIPLGSLCWQDFEQFIWPRTKDDPETIFTAEKRGNRFRLVAFGYGEMGSYGNGAIFIHRDHFGSSWTKRKSQTPETSS